MLLFTLLWSCLLSLAIAVFMPLQLDWILTMQDVEFSSDVFEMHTLNISIVAKHTTASPGRGDQKPFGDFMTGLKLCSVNKD